jgi:hypothetical protein
VTFQNSTRLKNWIFSKEKLDSLRSQAIEKGRTKIGSTISNEDYVKYLNYYQNELIETGRNNGFTKYQRSTALMFFKRIYVNKSIWEIPPPFAIICCNYLVAKFYVSISLEFFLHQSKIPDQIIEQFDPIHNLSKFEIEILESLQFQLRVFLPCNPLIALTEHGFSEEEHFEILGKLNKLLLGDSMLLFPPGVIALGAVYQFCDQERFEALKNQFGSDFESLIKEIKNLFDEDIPSMSNEEVSEIEKQLFIEYEAFQALKKGPELNEQYNLKVISAE